MPKITTDEILDALRFNPGKINLEMDICFVESIALFAEHREGHYRALRDTDLEAYLCRETKRLKSEEIIKNVDITANMAIALRRLLRNFIDGKADDVVSPYVALCDGMTICLKRPDGSALGFETEPWNRSHRAFSHIPYSSDEIANGTCPKFLAFLESMLVQEDGTTPDPELVDWVQLFLGNIILPGLSAQAVTFLVGSRAANGKSTLMDVVMDMIGRDGISAMSMDELSKSSFAVASLRGKRLNVGEEEESKYVSSALFKKLISGELVDADVKFGERVRFRNRAKFVFLTNSNPSFRDYDRGTRRRFFLVPFHRSFENDPSRREREELVADLLTELPGIWKWALNGAKRLIALKYVLPRTESMKKAQTEFENAIKSSYEFMDENYEISKSLESHCVATTTLYSEYSKWCETVGAQKMKRNNFVSDIANRYEPDGLTKKKGRLSTSNVQCFFGLRLRTETGSFLDAPALGL